MTDPVDVHTLAKQMMEAAGKATQGEWAWREEFEPLHMRTLSPGVLILDNTPGSGGPWGDEIDRANAAHIAIASPSNITTLCQAFLALKERVEKAAREPSPSDDGGASVQPSASLATGCERLPGNTFCPRCGYRACLKELRNA